MISYSTNFMGPIHNSWYDKRGIPFTETKHISGEDGQEYTHKEYEYYCAGGRIDVYGVDEQEYYCGRTELSLPIMKMVCFNMFSEWLDDFETEELWSLEQLVEEFEKQTEHKIEWV